ncbi:integrase arm-type DNA-binding domain-containing protein [Methyloceanibacter sp.]|uniref:tyrosine-type recombinase/integrase n=1 Tax=Methyloceanibacter sp. TaxID=1965321 RepID=UPI002C4D90E2|nr:integrase arm-type DNA-binding domain-containing protein [Methyloceanibacter sp.]HML93415.1 integrase arm-type DNA-binding domain-containing protein [Methyloceanibacter sp.]
MKTDQLSAQAVRTKTKPGYYCDGRGLYLQISQAGTKSWVFRYTLYGRTRDMGMGPYPTISLKEARERAEVQRKLLVDKIDPIETRRNERDEARSDTLSSTTFKDAAKQFLAVHEPTWRNDKHKQQWRNTLEDYAFPTLGTRPVAAIDAALINDAVASIWTTKRETARRVKQRIERVTQWVRDGKPMPSKDANVGVKHHPALPFDEIPEFMAELRDNASISARALEFLILTATRTGETIGAKWSEIDLDAGLWTIPAGRMKGGKEHEVPLSGQAVALLSDLPREQGGYVFPGARSKQPLSNMAMLQLLRGMRDGLTVHGFRSTFRDWAGDQTSFPRDVIEHALAHQLKNKTEASYRRSTALEKRRKLMEAWGGYCTSPKPEGNVVPMKGAA